MNIFGWSMPPGCSGPPEPPDDCPLCGLGHDDCECPECEVCGDQGCLTHLDDDEALQRLRQAKRTAHAMRQELARRDRAQPVRCGCGKPIPREKLNDGDPCDCWMDAPPPDLIPPDAGGIDLDGIDDAE